MSVGCCDGCCKVHASKYQRSSRQCRKKLDATYTDDGLIHMLCPKCIDKQFEPDDFDEDKGKRRG